MRLRRTGAVLAVCVLLSVAGCTGLLLQEETRFVAGEANVSDADELAYTHNTTERQNVTRSVEAAGQEREVTVSNHAELYVNHTADGSPGAAFAVVSSPQVRLFGEEMNPVADWSHRDILTEVSGQFDQYENLTDIEERETREVTMLGKEADVRVFNATMVDDNETSHDVVVSVAKVEHQGDYVVAIGIRGMNGADLSASDGDTGALVRRVEHKRGPTGTR
ncbi:MULTISPECIES: DUF6517 family protein [Haloarcula]|uniref:DUF6517 family protein n=1 Tax=Haloarcula TaxID=2237 RepID=UPI0023E82FC4|nr:DUF6517 family protein [Halomicroarcula sp. SHR3]